MVLLLRPVNGIYVYYIKLIKTMIFIDRIIAMVQAIGVDVKKLNNRSSFLYSSTKPNPNDHPFWYDAEKGIPYVNINDGTYNHWIGLTPDNSQAESVDDIKEELLSARGSRNNLNERISTISNFASPNAGGIVSGGYYDNSFHAAANSTLAGAANRWDMVPFYTSASFSIDQIGILVSTAVASSQLKIVIYDSGLDNWPNQLLYESDPIPGTATGFASTTISFEFESGRQYWLGVRFSSTTTIRTIPITSAVNLGLLTSTSTSYTTILRRTLSFATAAPSFYFFSPSDRAGNITPPSIRFRAS